MKAVVGALIGSGSFGAIGHGGGGSPAMNWQPIIERVKRACRTKGKGRVDVELMLQSHEIADIEIRRGKSQALVGCVVEALWKETIPRGAGHKHEWSKRLSLLF